MRLLAAWLLAAVLSGGPPIAIEGSVAGAETEIRGDYEATWDALGAVVRGRGDYSWNATAISGVLQLYNAPVEYAHLSATPLTPETWAFIRDHPLELMGEWPIHGELTIVAETGRPYLQWIPSESTEAHCQCAYSQTRSVGWFQSAEQQASVTERLGPEAGRFGVGAPPGKGAYLASTKTLHAEGQGRLVYYGVEIAADDMHFWTGARLNESRSPANMGDDGHFVEDRIFAVIQGMSSLDASGAGAEWAVVGGSLEGQVDLLIRRGTGTVWAAGNEYALSDQHLQVIGSLDADAAFGDQAGWDFEGQGYFVGIDTKTVAGKRAWVPAVATAAGLVGALAIAASGVLQKIAASLVKLRIRDPLEHRTRAQLVKTLFETPGHSHMELARLHGVSRRSVRYHLQVLLKAGIASQWRDGKIPRFSLNCGSSRFVSDSLPADMVFSAMAHPVRGAIIEAAREGPVVPDAFCMQTELTKSNFRYHCSILCKAGLLSKDDDSWVLRSDPRALREHYQRAFLVRHGLWNAYLEESSGSRSHGDALDKLRLLDLA